MADKNEKQPENLAGPYYVDETCIASKLCVAVAPDNIRMSDSGGHAYVFKQPESQDEKAAVHEALMGCPVLAIGDDG